MIAQLPSGRKSVSPSAKPSPQGPLGGVLGKFLGKVFTHFSRPRQKFLADMLYGIQASGDTRIPRGAAEPPKAVARGVLSSVMRAINDDSGKCHAVEKRLSRNVADATTGEYPTSAARREAVP